MTRTNLQNVLYFAFRICFVFTLIVSGAMLHDSAVISDFHQFDSGKTICCATPLEVLYGISLPECGKHCLSHPGCTVLSYQRRSLQCRLFDVDPTDSSFHEVDSTFVMVPVTRLSEEMILPCSRSHCSGFNKCTVTNSTSINCGRAGDLLNEWRLVYETDDDGDVVSGREGDLISAFQSASSVRVYVPSWNQTFRIDVTFILDANSACSQSLFQMTKETWSTFSAEATNVFYIFCTSGIYHRSLQYLSESSRPSDPDTIDVIGMKWFVR
ncbi:uncharacterized protein [Argopecten irradians]|uniref:uncharacterized protein n=1 Tax=Argopecten irradians TaxID=31199 RepID=UPI00371195FF